MYGDRGVAVDRTQDLRALWKPAGDAVKGQKGGPPRAHAADPMDAALGELRQVVAKVGGEVGQYCRDAMRRGDGDGADVVAQLVKGTDAQIQGLRDTIFEQAKRQRGLLAGLANRAGVPTLGGGGVTHDVTSLPQPARRHAVICDILADELGGFSADLFFVARYADGLVARRKAASGFPELARTERTTGSRSQSPGGDAAAKLQALKRMAMGEEEGGEDEVPAPSTSIPPQATRGTLRQRRRGSGRDEDEANTKRRPESDAGDAHEDTASGGKEPSMSNQVLLAALKDDVYQIKELGQALEQVANIADMIQNSLARQAEQVSQIESNAAETKGRIEDAEKDLREASKVKWTPKRMVSVVIFVLANLLLLFHLIRP